MQLATLRSFGAVAAALAVAAFLLTGLGQLAGSSPATQIPAPVTDSAKEAGPLQTAVLAGGCFWGVQGVYQHVRGVRNVLSGYAGGDAASARYDIVSKGDTKHAEAVRIEFDPEVISYGEILRIYFSVAHDPTQLDRQGPDVGPQYRSAIFYADENQKNIAESYIKQLDEAKAFGRPIVTRVDALEKFYEAEDYHQDFMVNNPRHRYILFHDVPKVKNLKKIFPELYIEDPVTVASNARK
jgi:peptide-methionine (S)-S-oxide reductase